MLDLHSPKWKVLSHAYGDADDVPPLIERLRAANTTEWKLAYEELMNAIMHQGSVYTAMYAAAPHLLELAIERGAPEQTDGVLCSIGYAARGGFGPEVPEFVEEAWEDAQDETRDLILERLLDRQASPEYAGLLIASVLYLSGEFQWGKLVDDWVSQSSIKTECANCGRAANVFWHDGGPKKSDQNFNFFDVTFSLSTEIAAPPDIDMEFEDDLITAQILGLAESPGYNLTEKQLRCLFGTFACESCCHSIRFVPPCE